MKGKIVKLTNDICTVEISIDEDFDLHSDDKGIYDFIYLPEEYKKLNDIKQWLSLLFCRSRNTMRLWLEAFILKTQTVQY